MVGLILYIAGENLGIVTEVQFRHLNYCRVMKNDTTAVWSLVVIKRDLRLIYSLKSRVDSDTELNFNTET